MIIGLIDHWSDSCGQSSGSAVKAATAMSKAALTVVKAAGAVAKAAVEVM